MKKAIVVLVVCCMGMTAMAQNEHIKFRDMELNMHISKFMSELKKLGYTVSEIKNDTITVTMNGKFGGKECELIISSTHKRKIVWCVLVTFKESDDWETLESDYRLFKDQFVSKYGQPDISFEKFEKPYYSGDGKEFEALENKKCSFISIWELKTGEITLNISKSRKISIMYMDKINSKAVTEEKEEIQSDI